jgi:hypothetical protein
MSFFGKILDKLGLRKSSSESDTSQRPTSTQSSTARQGSPAPQRSGAGTGATASQSTATAGRPANPSQGTAATTASRPPATVDVTAHLEALAAKTSEKLNWRTSIVDLLKLLDLDSSLSARKELADELGAPETLKDGSAEMNMWLHRKVLQKVAENGGNVPKELLD